MRKLYEDPLLDDYQIKLNFLGRLQLFPEELQECMKKLTEKTKDYNKFIFNFAFGYGGRSEVVDAAKKIVEQVKEGKLNIDEINEETFSNNLYSNHEPDLIIRTGGEKRTSNFLPYQAAYSEYIFLDKLWPEFDKEDFLACIEEYKGRERRFGR